MGTKENERLAPPFIRGMAAYYMDEDEIARACGVSVEFVRRVLTRGV